MRPLRRFFALVAILAVLVPLFLPLVPVLADNSKERHHTLTCEWSYHGDAESSDLAVLDQSISASEKASMEQTELRIALVQIAGRTFKEYPDYPAFPKSVTKADLDYWHCTWTENG